MARSRLWPLILLGRPHFLVGGFVLHGLGVTIALYAGAALNIAALVIGQVAITATQLMTHYANDYFDIEADRANETPTLWSGGSRVLVQGAVSPSTAHAIALTLAAVALAASVVLSIAIRPGVATFALLFVSIALAWFYSAPPVRLHSRGLGELTTALLVTGLTPITGYYLQTGQIMLLPLLAVTPLCLMQVAMLLSVEFPDAAGDWRADKRTLVVRWGGDFCARLYVTLILAPYVVLPLLVRAGLPALPAVAVWALFPLALWLALRAWRGDWRNPGRWSRFAFFTIALLMLTSAGVLVGFAIG